VEEPPSLWKREAGRDFWKTFFKPLNYCNRHIFPKSGIERMKAMVFSDAISLSTNGFCDIQDITAQVSTIAGKSKIGNGTVTIFCKGSTGAVTTIEYESGVLEDLKKAIERTAPSNMPYAHDQRWGDGNGFSHVRAALLGPSLTVPILQGSLALGTWQQIVFVDFDNRSRRRNVVVQVMGE
jgi:secondary thiamine-phosphate synthase enzyme